MERLGRIVSAGTWRTVCCLFLTAAAWVPLQAAEPREPTLVKHFSHWGYWYYHFRHETDSSMSAPGVGAVCYDFLVRLPLLRPTAESMTEPAPVVTVLHARQGDFNRRERRWPDHIVVIPDDNTDALAQTHWLGERQPGHTAWFGYHERFPAQPQRDTQVVPYTQRRLLYTLRFVLERFRADPRRVWVHGASMGGTGALLLALTHSEHLVGCLAIEPLITPAGAPQMIDEAERLFGPRQWNLRVAGTDIGVWDYLNAARWLQAEPPYPGWLQIEHGLKDRTVPFTQYLSVESGKPGLYDLLLAGRAAGTFVWDQRTHHKDDPLGRWYPPFVPVATGQVRLDRPAIIFQHVGQGQFGIDAGGLWQADCDPRSCPRGMLNAFVRWDGLIDEPDRLEVSPFLLDGPTAAWRAPVEQTRYHVTIRQPHQFPLPSGSTLVYTIGGDSPRVLTVQRPGEITVPDVVLHRGSAHATTLQLRHNPDQCITAVFSPTHPTRIPAGGDRVEVQCTLVGQGQADKVAFECRLLTRDRSRCIAVRRTADGKALFTDVLPGPYVVQARARCDGKNFGPATERWIYVAQTASPPCPTPC
ncbi:MAG TPA: alpha/beta hydrolase [Phycisphaerae bacterium]|nr:alpha/beta hydrolase [Phycisphaerae bacterium]